MKVRYRANGRIAEVSEAAGKRLVAARICERVEPEPDDRAAKKPKGKKPKGKKA